MRIKIKAPPEINSFEDLKKLNSWLYELYTAFNLGFSNIGEENLNMKLKNRIEGSE